MATSQIPAIIDALVTAATAALPSVDVYDGFGNTEDPGNYLMVGVEDPNVTDAAFAASSSQSPATMSTSRSRDEAGSITCAALSWNGDDDPKAARDSAFATAAAVATLLRTTPGLGIAAGGMLVTSYGEQQSLSQNRTEDGAMALLIFSIQFRARL